MCTLSNNLVYVKYNYVIIELLTTYKLIST